MKAISIHNPWAWAIFHAGKNIENRTRHIHYRGKLLIHASKTKKSLEQYRKLPFGHRHGFAFNLPHEKELAFGAVIGMVTVVDSVLVGDCSVANNPWASGPVCWIVENPIRFEVPIPYIGCQGFFDVPEYELPK